MSNDSGKDKLLEVVYSPKLMSIVSIFPVDNPDVEFFERRNGAVTVNIAPLRREWAYGKIPRLILLYSRSLIMEQSEKVDFDKKTIVFDESFRSFCKHAGLTYYGGLAKDVDEMLNRMLNTTIQLRGWFDAKEEQILAVGNYRIFDYGEFHFHDGDSSEKTYIRFSDLLWQILTENCVPLSREIATQLGRSPRALDIYQWLAYRTYALKKPVVVSWETSESVRFSGYAYVFFQTEVLQVVGEGVGRVAGAGDFRWGKRIDALSQQKLPHFGKRKGKGFQTGDRLFRKGVRHDGKPVLTKSLGHRFFSMPQAFNVGKREGKELCDNVVVHGEVLRVGHIPCCEFDFLQGLVVSAVS